MNKLAIFASGSGTNFQSIVDSVQEGRLGCEVVLLICDKPGARVLERAENSEVPTFLFNPQRYANKMEYEAKILNQLKKYEVDFIALAGYMRIVGPTLLHAYKERIVNIHPSLLPSFQGKDAIGQALEAKVKMTGVTVHYVDEGMDTGPIISQEAVRIDEDDTYEMVQQKIQMVEHELYPATLSQILKEKKKILH